MLYEKFRNGINLGGWLSQYDCIVPSPIREETLTEHLDTFITKEDLFQIQTLGLDHVRLPVSGYFLYDREKDVLRDACLSRIRQCFSWCEEMHLNVVLDLHDVWGNVYGAMEKPMPLLTDPDPKKIFIRIWQLLAEEFKDEYEGDGKITVMFELLNEVSDAGGAFPKEDPAGSAFDASRNSRYLWNQLYMEAISAIRKVDKSRWILVGANGQNHAVYLKELSIAEDPLVFYNFHYYDPMVFTHQRAGFSEEMREFNRIVHYPDDISSFTEYLEAHPKWKTKYALTGKEKRNDHALMEKLLSSAFRFQQETGRELYCGEYGVIATAPSKDSRAWITDLRKLFDEHRIGHALWNYKYLDFGLFDMNGRPASSLIVQNDL